MARNSLKNVCRLIEQAADELPVETSFLMDLKRTIEVEAQSGGRKPSQTYKPSSLKCIRNMYYQVVGADCDDSLPTYCSVGICNSGTDIHIRIQQAVESMKNNGIDCEYIDVAEYVTSRNLPLEIREKTGMETKLFYPDLNMSFMCDGIVRYKGKYYVLELKTEASFKWQKRTYVDSSHYNQGIAYSIAFNIPNVIFVYINRDILDMKAYMFTPDDSMKEELVEKITVCDEYVKLQTVPPMPTDVDRRTCDYCGYKQICKGV